MWWQLNAIWQLLHASTDLLIFSWWKKITVRAWNKRQYCFHQSLDYVWYATYIFLSHSIGCGNLFSCLYSDLSSKQRTPLSGSFLLQKDQNSIFCLAECISEWMKYESAILLSAVFLLRQWTSLLFSETVHAHNILDNLGKEPHEREWWKWPLLIGVKSQLELTSSCSF